MANELCPRCGSEMTYFNRGGELAFDCHYDKKDCRIAALEKELEEAKAHEIEAWDAKSAQDDENWKFVENLKSERDAALAQVGQLREALQNTHDALDEPGFVRCERCGWQESTADLDVMSMYIKPALCKVKS